MAEERGVIQHRPLGARRVARVMAGQGLQHQRAILGGPRHRTDMVEAEGGGGDPGTADEAIGRLDPGNAAQRRRPSDRAAGVGADAAEDHARSDRRAGAAAAAGGEVLGVPRVARRRCGQVEARPAIGELMRRQLAHQHRSGGGKAFGAGCVGVGNVVGEELRLAGGRNASGVDDVLEPDRDAVQRPLRAIRHDRRFGRPRLGQRPLGRRIDKGVQSAVERCDAIEAGARQFDRRQLLRRDQLCRFGEGRDSLAHCRSSSAKP